MADAGVLSIAQPAQPTPLVPHDISRSSYTYQQANLWWQLTSPTDGLVTIDSYLSTNASGQQPSSFETSLSTDGEELAQWQLSGVESTYLERILLRVTAGVPVVIDGWGGTWTGSDYDSNAAINLVLRVSDVIADTPSSTADVTSTKIFGEIDGFSRNRSVDLDYDTTLRSWNAVRRLIASGRSILNGTTNRTLIGTALDRARRTSDTTPRNAPYPALSQGNLTQFEWRDNTMPGLGFRATLTPTRVDADHGFGALFIDLDRLGQYAHFSGLLPSPGTSDDTIAYVRRTPTYADRVAQIEVAPDEITTSAAAPYKSGATWVIAQAQSRTQDPNGWGARYTSTTAFSALGNTAGPESLLSLPNAQVINYAGGLAPFVPISETLMSIARANVNDLHQLMIHGVADSALSGTNPLPPAYTYPGTSTTLLGHREASTLLMRVTWVDGHDVYTPPALFDPDDGAPRVITSALPGRRRFRPR